MTMQLRYVDRCVVREGVILSLAAATCGSLGRTVVCLEIEIDQPVVRRAMLEYLPTYVWRLGWQSVPGGWLLNVSAGDATAEDSLNGFFGPIAETFLRNFLDLALRSGNIVVRIRGQLKEDNTPVEIGGAVQPDGISVNAEQDDVKRLFMWQRRN